MWRKEKETRQRRRGHNTTNATECVYPNPEDGGKSNTSDIKTQSIPCAKANDNHAGSKAIRV